MDRREGGSFGPLSLLTHQDRNHQNNAGIYGTVTRIGRVAVGQTILLHAETT